MQKEDDTDFHAAALARFNAAFSPNQGVREMCAEASRFCWVPGAQWEGDTLGGTSYDKLMRRFPKFEVNKVRNEVNRIISEYKNSRISAEFRPGDSEASEMLADKLNGKLKADAQSSQGTEARNNAFTEAVSSGFGCFRLATSDDGEDDGGTWQENRPDAPEQIIFEPIWDAPRSVWFDTDSKLQNKSNATWAFVVYAMTPEKYKQEYGTDPASMETLSWGLNNFDWYSPDVVYVAQYYERRQVSFSRHHFHNALTGHEEAYDDDQLPEVEEELTERGYSKTRTHRGKRWQVYCSIVDGEKVLVEPVRLPGSYIPLVPVYGHRNYIDNIERITGHVQASMDSQRLYNMSTSITANIAANGGRQRAVLWDEEIAGFEEEWERADADDLTYVRLQKADNMANQQNPRPTLLGFTPTAEVPPAVSTLMQVTSEDIQQTAAAGQANQAVPGNVASETVASFMGRADMQSYGYLDNMALAERHAAQIWVSMAKEVYGPETPVRIVLPDGSDDITPLSADTVDPQTGESTRRHTLKQGRYDVAIDVGPAFTTQRQATVQMLIELLKETPPNNPYYTVLYAMLIQNVYAPGMEPLKEFNHTMMLQEGIIPPKTQQEAQQVQQYQQQRQQQAENSPEAQLARSNMMIAQSKERSSIADLMNAYAKIKETQADIWLKDAQAYSYVKNANTQSLSSAVNAFDAFARQSNTETEHTLSSLTGAQR